MSEASELTVSHRLRVRYAETDQMGVAYHANYLIWFNEARDALLREAGFDLAAFEGKGYRFPVVDISCRYLHSARYGDEVLVRAHLLREAVTVARLSFRFAVLHARTLRLLATGTSVSVVISVQGKLLLRMPPGMGQLLDGLAARRQSQMERTG